MQRENNPEPEMTKVTGLTFKNKTQVRKETYRMSGVDRKDWPPKSMGYLNMRK